MTSLRSIFIIITLYASSRLVGQNYFYQATISSPNDSALSSYVNAYYKYMPYYIARNSDTSFLVKNYMEIDINNSIQYTYDFFPISLGLADQEDIEICCPKAENTGLRLSKWIGFSLPSLVPYKLKKSTKGIYALFFDPSQDSVSSILVYSFSCEMSPVEAIPYFKGSVGKFQRHSLYLGDQSISINGQYFHCHVFKLYNRHHTSTTYIDSKKLILIKSEENHTNLYNVNITVTISKIE